MENKQNNKPKHQAKLQALDNLSLGISMVAAVAIGFGVGYGLKALTGYEWTLWLGVFWGVAAAGLNIQKAYKRAQKEFEGLENDPRYAHRAKYGDKSDNDDEDK
ncbi:AtpZ/AtpI family protein [Arcobacter roscoffensis]|uniref:AtpZ/AtpI family protein n=1 Tax=Arcobacter roscoffensis TaxID=2961520 RepID=A0ABY5EAJ3_9BACT|nr:AtpZ/AtpI family protein [Arcobacter roscoffensis]UTJ07745.1 AtpZ/AtpI family protein [Arcobacter roscoffensis]